MTLLPHHYSRLTTFTLLSGTQVAGASGNVVVDGGEDDEGAAEESYGEAILAALGRERFDEVLARLYIIRSDVQYPVRTEALHVWKTLVVNTPKTLGQVRK